MKQYRELTIQNNFMFTKVMSDERLMKKLLERIFPSLNIRDLKVVIKEKTLDEFASVHGIRIDVYSENDEAVYAIEMQVLNRGISPKRGRYYQSVIDTSLLNRNEDYEELKPQYIVFICPFDPFGDKMMMYTFRNLCIENGRELQDGTAKIYINCACDQKDDYPELKPFAEYVMGHISEDAFVREIDASVELARLDPIGRSEYMHWQEELREREKIGLEKGEENERVRVIYLLMKDGKSFEEACAFLQLSIEETEKIRRLLNEQPVSEF